jgi:hypothetical protein
VEIRKAGKRRLKMKILVDEYDASYEGELWSYGHLYMVINESGFPVWLMTYKGDENEVMSGVCWGDEKNRLNCAEASEFDYVRNGETVKSHEIKQVMDVLRERQNIKRKEIEEIAKDICALSALKI